MRTDGAGGPFASALASNAGGSGVLSFSNQSDQSGAGVVPHDGPGSVGLGGVDLAMGDARTRFEFAVQNADASMTINSVVTDTAGRSSMLTRTFPGRSRGTVALAFADHAGRADFGRVESIAFGFTGLEDLDAAFERITVMGGEVAPVLLPAGGVLLGAGLLGLGALRRRAG